jgi:hypothetical protein
VDRPNGLQQFLRRARRALATRLAPPGQSSDKRFPIYLDYEVKSVPRYGYGKPAHPKLHEIINRNRNAYRGLLESFLTYRDDLLRIPKDATSSTEPCWHNDWMTGLDAVALYSMLGVQNPARYLEVGSGFSTKFARQAIRDQGLKTEVISIDPHPRAEIDALCDRVVRAPLEDIDLSIFDELDAGDIVFIDGSHRSFMNSDATVAFLDVLPRIRSGVLVQIHDICLPWDYPTSFGDLFYSEQYLLASYLLAEGNSIEIVLPNFFVSTEPELHHVLDPLWDRFTWSATPTNGLSFWIRKISS